MPEDGQGSVVRVVDGVTPIQGDGSAGTGRRTTGNRVPARMRTEERDRRRDPCRALAPRRPLAAAAPTKRCGLLFRLGSHLDLLRGAGARVRQHTGGRTAGIDGQPRRQIDAQRLAPLADDCAPTRAPPQAVRRADIPKKTGQRA